MAAWPENPVVDDTVVQDNGKTYRFDGVAWVIASERTGGQVASDSIWQAAGDLAVGSGMGAAVRLPKGAEGKVLGIVGGVVAWLDAAGGGGGLGAAQAASIVIEVPPEATVEAFAPNNVGTALGADIFIYGSTDMDLTGWWKGAGSDPATRAEVQGGIGSLVYSHTYFNANDAYTPGVNPDGHPYIFSWLADGVHRHPIGAVTFGLEADLPAEADSGHFYIATDSGKVWAGTYDGDTPSNAWVLIYQPTSGVYVDGTFVDNDTQVAVAVTSDRVTLITNAHTGLTCKLLSGNNSGKVTIVTDGDVELLNQANGHLASMIAGKVYLASEMHVGGAWIVSSADQAS